MILLTAFAISALLLAAIGIYGSMAYSAQQRTQEIGIRIALGAASNTVRNMVIRQGLGVALLDVAIGLMAAYGLTRAVSARHLIASQLYGTQFEDAGTWTAVLGIVTAMGLLACAGPAWRAARTNPVRALRDE